MIVKERILRFKASVVLKVRQTNLAFCSVVVTATCLYYLHYNKLKKCYNNRTVKAQRL